MGDLLDCLRQRRPDLFAPLTKHDIRVAKERATAARRRANLNKLAGTGKARIAGQRTARYQNALLALIFRPALLAEQARYQNALLALIFRPALLAEQAEKDRIAQQLASDGGYEVSK